MKYMFDKQPSNGAVPIKVSFDSKNRAGRQDKRVTLTTNAVPQTKVLNITSTVISTEQ